MTYGPSEDVVLQSGSKRIIRLLVAKFKVNTGEQDSAQSKEDGDSSSMALTQYWLAKAGSRLIQVDSSLFIRDVQPSDSGLFVCAVNNSVGVDRVEVELLVKGEFSRLEWIGVQVKLEHFAVFTSNRESEHNKHGNGLYSLHA